jgi:Xaa-Pro aminopeptidase
MPFPTRMGVPLASRDRQLADRYVRHSKTPQRSALRALEKALEVAGLQQGIIGFDDPRVLRWLNDDGFSNIKGIDALNVFKEIRMVKSETEIEYLKAAGKMNEAALNDVIAALEPGLPLNALSTIHAHSMIDKGGRSEWVVANVRGLDTGVIEVNELIKLDAVGSYKQYRGDIGRTAICGEPTDEMMVRSRAVTEALQIAYENIRPGRAFKDIVALTLAACHDAGFPGFVIATPHAVGLEHTDHPTSVGAEMPGHHQLVFLENMVFTLDMPYHEFGWGTTHVEDMMIVRKNGCEAITSMDTSLRVKSV